ncbi:MAG: hypothetical protein ACYC6J_07975 [Coriobacteriia bacterium]
MPDGFHGDVEARLDKHGHRLCSIEHNRLLPDVDVWSQLEDWWLIHRRGANTPNWDLAIGCEIEGRRGLVLIEAKANVPELSSDGKRLSSLASVHSRENHERVAAAIREACEGWRVLDSGIDISIDTHYQLANRLAFTWKLATLGVPVVLLYLGFTGDEGIADAGEPFADDDEWHEVFQEHFAEVAPLSLLERRLEIQGTPVWILARSREAFEASPAPHSGHDLSAGFVKVESSEESVRVLVGGIEWDGPAHPQEVWEIFAELPLEASPDEIEQALSEARHSAAHFGECRWCGDRLPQGWMHDKRTCQSCAEKHLGAVH